MGSLQTEELVLQAAMLGIVGSAAGMIRSLFPQQHLRMRPRIKPARPLD